jgi:hypothetical protein
MAIWYILWSFGSIFHVLVCCTKTNLATLLHTQQHQMIFNGVDDPPTIFPINPLPVCAPIGMDTENSSCKINRFMF